MDSHDKADSTAVSSQNVLDQIEDGAPEEEEDAEERLARSRDRNREHARRTRLRKKAQLQVLQDRVKELETESRLLRQTLEECSIASILLGLSGNQTDKDDDLNGINSCLNRTNKDRTFFTMTGKRKRFVSDAGDNAPQPMKLVIKGRTTLVGGGSGKAHINWKTGVYLDENGDQQLLSPEELETLRRERNRMHAKMTRDRKKLYIRSVEKTISELESENKQMRELLKKQAMIYSSEAPVTPDPSPKITAVKNVPATEVPTMPLAASNQVIPEVVPETVTAKATSIQINSKPEEKASKATVPNPLVSGYSVIA